MKKVVTTINAIDKKQGMSPKEIAEAMRGAKYGMSATAVISFRGKIKSITLIEEKVLYEGAYSDRCFRRHRPRDGRDLVGGRTSVADIRMLKQP